MAAPRTRTGPLLAGLALAAGAVVLAVHAGRSAPVRVEGLVIEPGLRTAHVTFRTGRAVRASLEVSPAGAQLRLPAPDAAGVEHAFDVGGLAESADHTLTVVLEGGARTTARFRTQGLFIERLVKTAHLDRLALSWSTTLPVRTSLVYEAAGEPAAHLDVAESAVTTHAAEITGLSPDKDYRVTFVSHTAAGEVSTSAPFAVKLFTTAADEALADVERAEIPGRIRQVLWEYRHRKPDAARMRALLREGLDPIRPRLKQVREIAREFFSSPEVFVASKLKVYAALKMIEHLERLAAVRALPFVEMLAPFDWGSWAQVQVSFGDPARPLPEPGGGVYRHDPSVLSGVVADQQVTQPEAPHPLIELRPEAVAGYEMFGRGELDGSRMLTYRFALKDPARVAGAELWLMYRQASPVQFFEIKVNGRGPLLLRPKGEGAAMTWERAGVGVDPAFLVAGENVVEVELKSIPEMWEGRRAFVWFAELRTLPKK